MQSSIYKIKNLVSTFGRINDGQGSKKASKFDLKNIIRAPGSGISADLVSHHQGIYKCDGSGNFIVTGSSTTRSGYMYAIKGHRGVTCFNGKDYKAISKSYSHPGGIQVVDGLLGIGNEKYNGISTHTDRSLVKFYDISDSDCAKWKELTCLSLSRTGKGKIASAIGLTRFNDQYILAVRSLKKIEFFGLTGDYTDNTKRFRSIGSLSIKRDRLKSFQSINLYIGHNNKLYLFGMPHGSSNHDKCWLYVINTTKANNRIKKVVNANCVRMKHFKRNGSGPRFKWASCVKFYKKGQKGNVANGRFQVISASAHVDNNKIKCNAWNGV